jgi:hypothetical protein
MSPPEVKDNYPIHEFRPLPEDQPYQTLASLAHQDVVVA